MIKHLTFEQAVFYTQMMDIFGGQRSGFGLTDHEKKMMEELEARGFVRYSPPQAQWISTERDGKTAHTQQMMAEAYEAGLRG